MDIHSAAKALGSVKSPAKTRSSRENGKLGGRPSKDAPKREENKVHSREEKIK